MYGSRQTSTSSHAQMQRTDFVSKKRGSLFLNCAKNMSENCPRILLKFLSQFPDPWLPDFPSLRLKRLALYIYIYIHFFYLYITIVNMYIPLSYFLAIDIEPRPTLMPSPQHSSSSAWPQRSWSQIKGTSRNVKWRSSIVLSSFSCHMLMWRSSCLHLWGRAGVDWARGLMELEVGSD